MLAAWGGASAEVDGVEAALLALGRGASDAGRFNVILLDLNMPDIDGYGLARMVREDPHLSRLPMIMLTSSAERGEAERTQQAGIVAYLTKPVRSTQLRRALHTALSAGRRPRVPDGTVAPGKAEPPAVAAAATVLLVEDNIINQKVFVAMMASTAYRVDVAANGFEALEALEHTTYSAVFMDCQMPVMDGYQTTQRLREREGTDRRTVVIAVTASAMPADRIRCLDAGMDDFLTKPLRAEAIAAKLAYWVQPVPA